MMHLIPTELAQALHDYLMRNRPMAEVEGFVVALRTLEPVRPDPTPEPAVDAFADFNKKMSVGM